MGLSLQPLQIETLQVVPVKSVGLTETQILTTLIKQAGTLGWEKSKASSQAEPLLKSLLLLERLKLILRHVSILFCIYNIRSQYIQNCFDTPLQKVAVHLWMSKTEILNPWAEACSSCNWHRLVVNFGNIWTEQKWHVLNPLPNREIWDITPNYKAESCAVLLHIDYFDKENQRLGVPCQKKDSWKEVIVLEKMGERVWKESGEDAGCRKDPGSGRRSQRTGTCIEINAGEWPGTLTSNTCGWSTLTAVAQQEPTQLCPAFPGQQWPPCREGKSRHREHNAVVGKNKWEHIG